MALQNTDLLIVQRNQQSYKMPASELLGIIPPAATVGDGTITIVQPGTNNQTFTVNQSGNTTITLKNDNTIPNNGQITIVQPGTSDQTFTVNQSGNTTITLRNDNTNTTYSAGNGLSLSGTTFSVAGGTGLTQETNGLKISDNGVSATQLNVSGNGTAGNLLQSDGDGSFSWTSGVDTTAFVAKTGDTMSGALTIEDNLTVINGIFTNIISAESLATDATGRIIAGAVTVELSARGNSGSGRENDTRQRKLVDIPTFTRLESGSIAMISMFISGSGMQGTVNAIAQVQKAGLGSFTGTTSNIYARAQYSGSSSTILNNPREVDFVKVSDVPAASTPCEIWIYHATGGSNGYYYCGATFDVTLMYIA